jgi:undecaprenyl-diphosphatase
LYRYNTRRIEILTTTNVTWRRDPVLLVSIVLIVAGIALFILLTNLVMEGRTQEFDERILLALRDPDPAAGGQWPGPHWVQEAGRDITALGGGAFLFLLSLFVGLYLLLQRKVETFILLLAAILGGVLFTEILKELFGRPRPDLVPHGTIATSTSFPSGHSIYAAATYLTLAVILIRVHTQRRMRALFVISALVITFLVGFSRVYLGVHWPADVLGGWLVGGVWALICWTAIRALHLSKNG